MNQSQNCDSLTWNTNVWVVYYQASYFNEATVESGVVSLLIRDAPIVIFLAKSFFFVSDLPIHILIFFLRTIEQHIQTKSTFLQCKIVFNKSLKSE